MTDTRHLRDEHFNTIVGAELSSAPWTERDTYWVTAAGLLLDFGVPPADDRAEAIARARDAGAFVVMLHPGLNNLPLAAADGLPALGAVQAVEVYNHNSMRWRARRTQGTRRLHARWPAGEGLQGARERG